MNIKDIIAKYYNTLHEFCSDDKVISQSRTEEDILQDVCITAMRKFKNKDVDEEEGLSYLKKTLWTEQHFQSARKKKDILILADDGTAKVDTSSLIEPEFDIPE